ncbi:hypothetical protein C8J57DRAFT_1518037 [Mycena rebaudengoi]|nr:hypothetical protein C8J57DRAFT_1518037 [Mycena rebaudengoi]
MRGAKTNPRHHLTKTNLKGSVLKVKLRAEVPRSLSSSLTLQSYQNLQQYSNMHTTIHFETEPLGTLLDILCAAQTVIFRAVRTGYPHPVFPLFVPRWVPFWVYGPP